MLRIKLVKTGKKKRPTWRIVVVEKTKTGKGRVSGYIGSYNPHLKPKGARLDSEAYANWVKNGAQPTDAVLRIKGKYIDDNKDYQKKVKPKVYKKKKPEEAKPEAPKPEKKEEEVKEVAPEVQEEPKETAETKEEVKDAGEEKAQE